MKQATRNHPDRAASRRVGRAVSSFWYDAFLATILAHLAFVAHLRITGWTYMAADWLRGPCEFWWWVIDFFPGFAMLLFIAFRFRPRHCVALGCGTVLLYIAIATLTPRLCE